MKQVLQRIRNECNRVLRVGFLKNDTSKSSRLEEFEHMHNTSINAFANSLRDNWVTAIKNHVRTCLKDMGKGWFNLNESDNEVRGRWLCVA